MCGIYVSHIVLNNGFYWADVSSADDRSWPKTHRRFSASTKRKSSTLAKGKVDAGQRADQPRSGGTDDNSNGLLLRRWLRSSRGVAPKKLR